MNCAVVDSDIPRTPSESPSDKYQFQADAFDTSERAVLQRAIVQHAIYFVNRMVFDFRRLLTHPDHVRTAGRLMWQLVKPLQPQVLIGPGFGASPLIYSIAIAALDDGVKLNLLMVRDRRKEYNQRNWVEGDKEAAQGKRAVLVDDFMSAGSAVKLVEKALLADKVTVTLQAVALFFDMWEPLGSRQISLSKLPVLSLFSRHDVGLSRDCYDAVPPLMKGKAPAFITDTPRWWRFEFNRGVRYSTKCSPAIVGDHVLVADENSQLWSHSASTGDIQWSLPGVQRPVKGIIQRLDQGIYQDNAYDPERHSLVYGSYDGTLTRVCVHTGRVHWRFKLDSSIHATPCIDVANNRLFINTEQWNDGVPTGHAYCLALDSGRIIWRYAHPWWPPAGAIYAAPQQAVIAPCNDQSITCLDANTGQVRWRSATKGLVRGQALIYAQSVIVATELGYVHCFDLTSGQQVWQQRYGKGLFHQFLQADGDCVFVMDGKWHLIAMEIATGQVRWLTRLRSTGCWQPVRCGRYWVVLSEQGHLAVMDPVRQLKVWESSIPGTYRQPPAICPDQGLLVAASSTQGLLAFDINPYYTA
jgi:outer membrane protein assembly factor BamB/orotate phosphoribosyltransferase